MYSCRNCSEAFDDDKTLNFHVKFICKLKKKLSYSCPGGCQQKFTSLELLNMHLDEENCNPISNDNIDDEENTTTVCPNCSMKVCFEELSFHIDFACTPPSTLNLSSSTKKLKREEILECPACQKVLKLEELNFHLDTGCSSKMERNQLKLSSFPSSLSRKPPGLVVLENFLSEKEELEIIQMLQVHDKHVWSLSKRNGKCLSRHWGIIIDYSTAKPRTRFPIMDKNEKNMPNEFNFIIERFTHYSTLASWFPNECNANLYDKDNGDFLTPHFDDRKLSGDIICNVNLLSDCVMTFRKPNSNVEPFRVLLPRFSASVMSRSSRFDYTHEISNEDFLGPRRISLNFRQQVQPLEN